MSAHFASLADTAQQLAEIWPRIKSGMASLEKTLAELDEDQQNAAQGAGQLRRQAANAPLIGSRRRGHAVTPEFARYLGASAIVAALDMGRLAHYAGEKRQKLRHLCQGELLGYMEHRTALTSGDIPLPSIYAGELVSLVSEFGAARKYGTVFPMGRGKLKLPRLKTSPGFGFISMSAALGEKAPQIEFIEFPPEKAGGLVRIPNEIDQDSIVQIGAFVAEYIARELARFEDDLFFNADGTATYKGFKGVAKAALDNSKAVTLGAGRTKASDIQIADVRAMRGKTATTTMLRGAYYFHSSMEALLQTFNTNGVVYFQNTPGGAASFENFPVRWIDTLPAYSTSANAGALQGVFGDLTYQFLGVVSGPSVKVSDKVLFSTDELAVMGLERLSTALMDQGAASVLQLAAS